MSKIIEPSMEYAEDFIKFITETYGLCEFSMAEAANAFFQKRYQTDDKWTDPKNITGFVRRRSTDYEDENCDTLFEFIGEKPSKSTRHKSKHYRLIDFINEE